MLKDHLKNISKTAILSKQLSKKCLKQNMRYDCIRINAYLQLCFDLYQNARRKICFRLLIVTSKMYAMNEQTTNCQGDVGYNDQTS